MNRFFSEPVSKVIVDVLLIAGFFVSILSSRRLEAASWGSFHCIASMTWYALMLVHILQHWRWIKSLSKRKVIKRNIITTLTVIVFILMTVSIGFFLFGIDCQSIHIHHAIAHLFWIMILIHAIQKAKRFVHLFKKTSK